MGFYVGTCIVCKTKTTLTPVYEGDYYLFRQNEKSVDHMQKVIKNGYVISEAHIGGDVHGAVYNTPYIPHGHWIDVYA
jgi:hypothetical protein